MLLTRSPYSNAMNVFDSHCHLSCHPIGDPKELISVLHDCDYSTHSFNIMSTNAYDLPYLEKLVEEDSKDVIVPYLGIHPWYSHLFSLENSSKEDHYSNVLSDVTPELIQTLPEPISLQEHLDRLYKLGNKYKSIGKAFGIGEVGLDKLFRIPSSGYYGSPHLENISLTKSKVRMEHQLEIFRAQMELANELQVPVSLHCVKAHGALYDALSSKYLSCPHIILHSYSGSLDQAKRWVKDFKEQNRKLMFSLSQFVNGKVEKSADLQALVLLLEDHQILLESDFPIDQYFLKERTDEYTEAMKEMQSEICRLKGWTFGAGQAILLTNSGQLITHE